VKDFALAALAVVLFVSVAVGLFWLDRMRWCF
jgi:hypothetical protein